VSWAVSAAVVVHGMLTGLGQVTSLVLVGLQTGFGVAWTATYMRVASIMEPRKGLLPLGARNDFRTSPVYGDDR